MNDLLRPMYLATVLFVVLFEIEQQRTAQKIILCDLPADGMNLNPFKSSMPPVCTTLFFPIFQR